MPCHHFPTPKEMSTAESVAYIKSREEALDKERETRDKQNARIRELLEQNGGLKEKLDRLTELLCTLSRDIPEDQMPKAYKEWTLQHLRVDVSRLTEEVIQRALNKNDIPLLKQIRDALEPLEEPRILEQEA